MREEIHRNSPLIKGVKGVVIEIERESHEGRFS
jgi:hypothetical protein